MIVVDASVLTSALIYTDGRGRKARLALGRDPEWTAPEHWRVEVFSAIRGLLLGRRITEERADWALGQVRRLGVDTVPVDELLPRMWQLRATISGYDAGYVALAERRALTLLTADGHLARAATPHCRVELIT